MHRLAVLSFALPFALLGATAAAQAPAPAAAPASAAMPDVLAAAAKEPGAVKTDSGLVFRSLTEGKGPSPTADDTVRVHYRGTLANGKEFDSSYGRGQPTEFPLKRVIKCWTEGVQRMNVGGKAKLTCPANLAYGERSVGGGLIPPNSVLQFEVELLAIATAAAGQSAPPNPHGGASPHGSPKK
jgi:FKBP-type peptidyl-prolyl cis-trans isomerase FkpA